MKKYQYFLVEKKKKKKKSGDMYSSWYFMLYPVFQFADSKDLEQIVNTIFT